MPTRRLVYIYAGEGATASPFETLARDPAIACHARFVFVDSRHIRGGFLHRARNLAAFVMPGNGSAGRYLAALGRRGTEALRDYVALGGTYVGICSGAYIAASRIEYRSPPDAPPIKREAGADHLLGFFKGTCHGTLPRAGFAYIPDAGWNNAIPVNLRAADTDAKVGTINWGGPYYIPADRDAAVALAAYDPRGCGLQQPEIAIAATRFGLGHAILSGVHLEITPAYMREEAAMRRDRDGGARRAMLAAQLETTPQSWAHLFRKVFPFLQPPSPK